MFQKTMNPTFDQFEEDNEEIFLKDKGYVKGIAQDERVRDLSEDQERAIEYAKNFIMHTNGKHIVIGGVAGSGKTTIIPHIILSCGRMYNPVSGYGNVAVCAYTGKAVMNLKRKGLVDAITLHSFLYNVTYEKDPISDGLKVIYTPKSPLMFNGIDLLIVDEASMVNREMYDMIESLPFKTIYIGDHYQLPPVNDDFNIMQNPNFKLEQIHRQEENNPIVQLADMARHGKSIPLGVFGSSKHTRSCNAEQLLDFDEVITWTNATREAVNDLIRRQHGFPRDIPQEGDKMIVKMNCKPKNVYNGQIVYLVSEPLSYKQVKYAWNVEFIDELAYNDTFIMAQTDMATKAIASVHMPKDDFDKIRRQPHWSDKKAYKQFKKENPYQVYLDWGYAITCHAAQGTSWKNVAVMLEDRMKMFSVEERSRWIYTAITRAEESVTIYSGDFSNL